MNLGKIHTPLPLVNSEAELEAVQNLVGKHGPRGGMVFWEDGQEFVKIPLTQGKFALIDRADYEEVGRFRWCAHKHGLTYYAHRRIGRHKLITMHQTIRKFSLECDHKNRNGLDNRRRNLRDCTRSVNCQNRRSQHKLWKGVTSYKGGRFVARIAKNGVLMNLGSRKTAEQAASLYDAWALELYGDEALLNFPIQA